MIDTIVSKVTDLNQMINWDLEKLSACKEEAVSHCIVSFQPFTLFLMRELYLFP